jgi:flagellar hook protein FlgE
MDVVGNNIANVNTTGYKSGATVFQDVLSQTLQGAGAPLGAGQGGTNPAQVGLGVTLGGISTNLAQGAMQLTGRTTDLAIEGDGLFVAEQDGERLYTRAGSFNVDVGGRLVTPSGAFVLGYQNGAAALSPITIDSTLDSFSISKSGAIVGVRDGVPEEFAQLVTANFNNPGGLDKTGGSFYRESVNSGAPQIGFPGVDGRGLVSSGVLEMSNVDLAQEFTNLIVAQRGFQANSRIISASDELLQDLVNLKR